MRRDGEPRELAGASRRTAAGAASVEGSTSASFGSRTSEYGVNVAFSDS